MTQFQEYEQDPDITDSAMMEVIRDYIALGWGLVEYKWSDGVKIWTFQKG